MHKLEAFLRPSALEAVQGALSDIGLAGMSVSEVRGFGRQRGHHEVYRGAEYRIDFVPKIRSRMASLFCLVAPA
jgi:nitrogen regulatory protein P-II 1